MQGISTENGKSVHLSSSRSVGTLVFLTLAIYFRFVGGTWLVHINSYYHRALNTIIAFLIVGTWLIWKIILQKKLSIIGIERYLALFVLVVLISTASADNLSLSSDIAVNVLGLILATYIILDIKESRIFWDALINGVVVTGMINALLIIGRIFWWFSLYQVSLVDLYRRPLYLLNILPRLPDIPNFNPNVTAAYFLLIIPLVFFKAKRSKNNFIKISFVLFALILLSILFMTKSRGAYIGLAFSLGSAIIIYRHMIISWYKTRPVAASLLTGIVGAVSLIGGFVLFRSRGNILGPSVVGRIEGWKIALELIAMNPLFGTGLGGYGIRFMQLIDPAKYGLLNLHAHNEILNIATSLGLVGVFAIALLVYQYTRLISREASLRTGDKHFFMISLVGFLAMGLVDSYLISSNIVLIVLLMLVGMLPSSVIKKVPLNGAGTAIVFVTVVFLGGMGIYANWRLTPYHKTRESIYNGNLEQASIFIDEAIRRDPKNPFYLLTKAQISGERTCLDGLDPSASVEAYRAVMPIYENWPPVNLNLASIYAYGHDYQQAVVYIQRAANSGASGSLAFCMLGDFQLALELEEESIESYTRCLGENPDWFDSPYWSSDGKKTGLEDRVVESLLLAAEKDDSKFSAFAQVMVFQGQFDQVEDDVNSRIAAGDNDPHLGLVYADYLSGLGKMEEAGILLERITNDHPRYPAGWAGLANNYLEKGLLSESKKAIEISLALQPTPESLILSGLINTINEDFPRAIEDYYKALYWQEPPSIMSAWTARRFPLPHEGLSCLPDTRTYRGFYDIAWKGIEELAKTNCPEAEEIYRLIDRDLFPEFDLIYGGFPASCGS